MKTLKVRIVGILAEIRKETSRLQVGNTILGASYLS
jgi:hypothetical protein